MVIAIMDSGIDTGHVDLDDGKVIGWVDSVSYTHLDVYKRQN